MLDFEELGLDEEQAKALKALLEEKDSEVKALQRDLKLAKGTWKKDYPRAWLAYEKGRLDLSGVYTDEEIKAALRAKEEELAELGVSVPGADQPPAAAAPPDKEPGKRSEPSGSGDAEPTGAFGTPQAGGQAPTTRNLLQEALEALKGDTEADRLRYYGIVREMNEKGHAEDLRQLNEFLSAPPIRQRIPA